MTCEELLQDMVTALQAIQESMEQMASDINALKTTIVEE
jgi:hypothetical protein